MSKAYVACQMVMLGDKNIVLREVEVIDVREGLTYFKFDKIMMNIPNKYVHYKIPKEYCDRPVMTELLESIRER